MLGTADSVQRIADSSKKGIPKDSRLQTTDDRCLPTDCADYTDFATEASAAVGSTALSHKAESPSRCEHLPDLQPCNLGSKSPAVLGEKQREKSKEEGRRHKGKGKRDPRMGTEVRKNGKLFKDRVCSCGKKHWHGDNTCITCQNALHKKRHGYNYKKRKEHPWYDEQQKVLTAHAESIAKETAAIEAAGLNTIEYPVTEIEKVLAGTITASQARKAVEHL